MKRRALEEEINNLKDKNKWLEAQILGLNKIVGPKDYEILLEDCVVIRRKDGTFFVMPESYSDIPKNASDAQYFNRSVIVMNPMGVVTKNRYVTT